MAESEDELKNLFLNVEEESEKAGLKLNIIHVTMRFSQIILPSPSPTESKDCSIHLFLFNQYNIVK